MYFVLIGFAEGHEDNVLVSPEGKPEEEVVDHIGRTIVDQVVQGHLGGFSPEDVSVVFLSIGEIHDPTVQNEILTVALGEIRLVGNEVRV